MARIIYKDGCEGQNRLESIEGIEIDLLNGQKALIYPRYRDEVLLDQKDRDRWHDAKISETAALRLRDNQAATAALPDFDSLKIPFFLRSDNQYIVKSADFSG